MKLVFGVGYKYPALKCSGLRRGVLFSAPITAFGLLFSDGLILRFFTRLIRHMLDAPCVKNGTSLKTLRLGSSLNIQGKSVYNFGGDIWSR